MVVSGVGSVVGVGVGVGEGVGSGVGVISGIGSSIIIGSGVGSMVGIGVGSGDGVGVVVGVGVGVGEDADSDPPVGAPELHLPAALTMAPFTTLMQKGSPVASSYIVMPVGFSLEPTFSSSLIVALSTSSSFAIIFPFSSTLQLP